jgi:hypothetical protein
VGAFAALHLIWGSTYLAIRFALETLSQASLRSWIAVMYLLIFGSLIALSAAVKSDHTGAGFTHAYLNPCGCGVSWMVASWRSLNSRMLFAMGVIIAAVVISNRQGEWSAQTLLNPESRQRGLEDGFCASE